MKAPDKIYIRPMLNPSDGYVGIAWAEAHGGMEEYVRKDALLEWLKDNLQEACNEPSAQFEYYESGKISGEISAFEHVIGKLNSM